MAKQLFQYTKLPGKSSSFNTHEEMQVPTAPKFNFNYRGSQNTEPSFTLPLSQIVSSQTEEGGIKINRKQECSHHSPNKSRQYNYNMNNRGSQLTESSFNIPLSQITKSNNEKEDFKAYRKQESMHSLNPNRQIQIPAAPIFNFNSMGSQITESSFRITPSNTEEGDFKVYRKQESKHSSSIPNRHLQIPAAPKFNLNSRGNQIMESSFALPLSQIVQSQTEEKGVKGSRKPESLKRKFQSPTMNDRGTKLTESSLACPPSQYIPSQVDKIIKQTKNSVIPSAGGIELRSIRDTDLPKKFQNIFSFPYFNVLQSLLFDEVFYTDKSIIASAPTGSGKTVLFELALIRLIMKTDNLTTCGKIIYMAPMKALCTERFQDWSVKFGSHGFPCLEVTGDTELDDVGEFVNAKIICTTPEKWDSMSRRWKDNRDLFQQIKLFLIDEIHTVNDSCRGATVEAVVSRMKTLQNTQLAETRHIRFIAVSATMPNYGDIADWLGTTKNSASAFNLGEEYRPVKLERIVLGYPFKEGTSDFRFDMNLSYRLRAIIETHSHGKPTLVFCSSRKSVIQSAEVLARDIRPNSLMMHFVPEVLRQAAGQVSEHKLSELLRKGVGIHHAGLDSRDRHIVEELFKSSQLPVLVSTSTLAMGVNLPAHLVVIKSTHFYNMGVVQEYSDMQILQMIGRAGRPQFDTFATAVIMTKTSFKSRYESLLNGTQLIESSLHKHLIEHLNAEIVLQTISEIGLVLEWIKHTFLYVRALKNPKYYGFPANLDQNDVEKQLKDLCLKNLRQLSELNLVSVNTETRTILPTTTGRLMARYCIAYETMKHFHHIGKNQGNIADMLIEISKCAEFEDIQLRTNEKRILNTLNRDKNKESIRFPMSGKIKTKQMKVNCLIQAQLSCLPIQDFSLSQDLAKIFRVGQRVTKCFMEFMLLETNYLGLLHAVLIYKSVKAKIWFDSRYVARQLDGIGPTMSLALANSGLSSFQKIEQANARDIEMIVNRHPPFGNQIKEAVALLPRYELSVEQLTGYKPDRAVLQLTVDLSNRSTLEEKANVNSHQSLLIIGDAGNNLIFQWRIVDSTILKGEAIRRTIEIKRSTNGSKLNISLLSLDWVGLDIQTDYEPVYTEGWFSKINNVTDKKPSSTPASKLSALMEKAKAGSNPQTLAKCQHKCLDKSRCGHKCCKTNPAKRPNPMPSKVSTPKIQKAENRESKFLSELRNMKTGGYVTTNSRISIPRNPRLTPLAEHEKNQNSCSNSIWAREKEISHLKNQHSFDAAAFSKGDNLVQNDINTEDLTWSDDDLALSDDDLPDIVVTGTTLNKDTDNQADDSFDEALVNENIEPQHTTEENLPRPSMTSSKQKQDQNHLNQMKNANNLDISLNPWADLDVFQQSRQDLYKNGRPLHLQNETCDSLELSQSTGQDNSEQWFDQELPESSIMYTVSPTECLDSGWPGTTSSDEDLCKIVEASVSPYTVGHQSQESMPNRCLVSDTKNIDPAERVQFKLNLPYVKTPTRLDSSAHPDNTRYSSDSVSNYQQSNLEIDKSFTQRCKQMNMFAPNTISSKFNHEHIDQQLNSYTFEPVDKHQPQQVSSISASLKDDNLSPIISSSYILHPSMTRNVSDQNSLSRMCDVSQQASCLSSPADISDRIPVPKDANNKKFSESKGDENDVPSSHRYGHVKAWTKNALKTKTQLLERTSSRFNNNFVPASKVLAEDPKAAWNLFDGIF
ncbi:probable ATP-dependent DNA helicase HFM1 [Physella acuta]|uniref:probable ATP-dependent DNA helicase HFM1 n=1 Tax=Physella acuta TaxID=109671 RepID=UPI0027DE27F1|nr:probable ATP-dependent DNA helicase HFM1 [Physella acuta]